jgi:murein DD-endopeptidase MepM/ murein hydrolase activator NlpD
MNDMGVSAQKINDLVTTAKPFHSLSKLKTGESINIIYNQSTKEIIAITHEIDFKSMLFVNKSGNGFAACIKDIPHEKSIKAVTTEINNNLYDDGLNSGISARKILELTDIFSWDIDFFTGMQKGDTFSIVFEENKRNGTVVSEGAILAAQITKNGKLFQAFYFSGEKGKGFYYDEKGRSLKKQFLKSPLRFSRISSGFSKKRFHPILQEYRPHYGIDYAAPPGSPIEAVADGIISFAGWKGGYGNYIVIKHSGNYATNYGHLSRCARGIKAGCRVTQGEVIGFVGATGLTTGPHLDFRLAKAGSFINPLSIKNIETHALSGSQMLAFKRTVEVRIAQLFPALPQSQQLAHNTAQPKKIAD